MPYTLQDLPANVRAKPAKTRRQWVAVWNSSYEACVRGGGDTARCESEAFARANGVIKASEMPDGPEKFMEDNWGLQLEKTAPQVNYRPAEGADKTCANCRFFYSEEMRCAVVEGTIDPAYTSDLWTERMSVMPPTDSPDPTDPKAKAKSGLPAPDTYHEQTYRVFIEAPLSSGEDFTKPRWIPFLPKPGIYTHQRYGTVDITPGRNLEMVEGVKKHVYQESIPLDAEHQTKMSGAVAWLKDMRMNDDGSADAFVELTARGQQMLKTDSFRYVSPEWFDEWPDPVSGEIHRNVVIGGAITTRPFFKDKVLRSLVASEGGMEIIGKEDSMPGPNDEETPKAAGEGDPTPTPPPTPTPAPPNPEPAPGTKTFTEAEYNAAIAKAKTDAEDAAKTATEKTFSEQLTAETEARKAVEARLATREKADRSRQFTETVAGRGGANDGGIWAGDAEKHVAFMESLAEKFGEDSDELKAYIEQQSAIAAQFKEASSGLFRAAGVSGGSSGGGGSDEKATAAAQKLVTDNPGMKFSEALEKVYAMPEFQRQYAEEHGAAPVKGA